MRRAANATAKLAERLAPIELKISNAIVLLLVGASRVLTSSGIGKVLDIQRANMAPLLNRLETMGLIQHEPIDHKSLAIVIIDSGRNRLKDVCPITETFENELLAWIPAQHREHLVRALEALID